MTHLFGVEKAAFNAIKQGKLNVLIIKSDKNIKEKDIVIIQIEDLSEELTTSITFVFDDTTKGVSNGYKILNIEYKP